MNTFGKLLERFRKRISLSQHALAKEAGIDSSYINRLERGLRKPPSRKIIEDLARVMLLNTSELQELLLVADYSPRRVDNFVLASPLTLKNGNSQQQKKESVSPFRSPAYKVLAEALSDPRLSDKQRKEMEKEIVSFIKWQLHHKIKNHDK